MSDIQPFGMIETAVMQMITEAMPEAENLIGGDLSYDAEDDFYIWIGQVPGGGFSDETSGQWTIDIDVFDSTYGQAMRRSLDLEAIMLRRGGRRTSEMLIDSIVQNASPSERPWDDDESAYRVGGTYVLTARRRG